MQTLTCIHAPIYHKHRVRDPYYTLRGFSPIKAQVNSAAAVQCVWTAMDNIKSTPSVLFTAGDWTSYLTFSDDKRSQVKRSFNLRHPDVIQGTPCGDDMCSVKLVSSIVSTNRGLLQTAPVEDHHVSYPLRLWAGQKDTHIKNIADMQSELFKRVRENVQFLDVQDGEVLDCQRLQNGCVGRKRKRNLCSDGNF